MCSASMNERGGVVTTMRSVIVSCAGFGDVGAGDQNQDLWCGTMISVGTPLLKLNLWEVVYWNNR